MVSQQQSTFRQYAAKQKCHHHFLFPAVLDVSLRRNWCDKLRFYRAMHFRAKRGIAIACRLSLRLSVCDVGEL